ncbi:MAG: ATPase [Rhodobacteraceae bacterium]|nr:ATPase [Paracoccaceae bacterium]
MDPGSRLILGIDGGGSGSRAALLVDGRRIEASAGPCNVASGFDAAIAALGELYAALAARAGLSPEALRAAPAWLGLAGVTGEAAAGRVKRALGLAQARVTDDLPTTLAGALGGRDGAVAAIGTGSVIGAQREGRIRRVGGWGFVLGDQASGAWLGRRAAEAALLARDGLEAEGPLSAAVMARFGGDPDALVAFAFAARPADFADLAPAVIGAAGQGDALALRLVGEGADYIRRGLAALGHRPGEALVMAGGLGPFYAGRIGLPVVAAAGSALDGALRLAALAAGGSPCPSP